MSASLKIMLAEGVGTMMLLCVVIGSGIMGEQLAGGNTAIALLTNTLATVFGLYVLITTFGPISGAHFNPVVTLYTVVQRQTTPALAATIIVAQLVGAWAGACLAHAMFDVAILQVSLKARDSAGLWLGEVLATLGLLWTIRHFAADKVAGGVAAYIGAAYLFTSSTSFANPAAVFGRMFSDSFAGIAPASAPAFVLAQLLALAVFVGLERLLARAA